MAFEITGKVIDILPVNQVSDKFRKREFVIERKETEERHCLSIYQISALQDKCDLINESFMNEEVKVTFNIKGNRWNEKVKSTISPTLMPGKLSEPHHRTGIRVRPLRQGSRICRLRLRT